MNAFIMFVFVVLGIVAISNEKKRQKPIKVSVKKSGKQKNIVSQDITRSDNFFDKYYVYFLIFAFLLGIAVRAYKFGIVPFGFNQDGAMAAVDAFALSEYGTDRLGMWMPVHFTAWGVGQMSVLLSYLMVPFIKLFGLNNFSARLPMLIVSLAGLWVMYDLTKRAFGKNIALVVLFFCAINPWQIMQSRWAVDCNMFPHFILFSVYFMYLGLEKKKYLYISMIFIALSMYGYGIAVISVPAFLTIAFIYFPTTKKVTIKETLICAGIYLLIAWPIIAVMIINTFKLPSIETPLFTIPSFPNSTKDDYLLMFSPNKWEQLKSNIHFFNKVVVFQGQDSNWNSIKEYGSMYLFSIPLIIFGFYFAFKNRKNDFLKICFAWLAASILVGCVVREVNINRMNIIFYPLMLFISFGIYYIIKNVKYSVFLFLIIYTISFSGFCTSYFTENNKSLSYSFFYGLQESLHEVNNEYDKVYVTNFAIVRSNVPTCEILTLYHNRVDAQYYMGKRTLYKADGTPLLPYSQRYQYVDFEKQGINIDENAIYIIHQSEFRYFPTDKFKVDVHNDYAVAVRK